MTPTERITAEIIIGARIWWAPIGANLDDAGELKVSDTAHPELPESYANPGQWVSLGKIREAKVQTDYKTSDVEGVGDLGIFTITEMKLAQKRKVQFSTNDITPEAYQMTFGLLETPEDGKTQTVFASGNDTLEGWLAMELTDAYRSKTGLARFVVRAKLTMQNPLEAKSDPALASYEASIMQNALAEFETLDLNKAAE